MAQRQWLVEVAISRDRSAVLHDPWRCFCHVHPAPWHRWNVLAFVGGCLYYSAIEPKRLDSPTHEVHPPCRWRARHSLVTPPFESSKEREKVVTGSLRIGFALLLCF